MYFFLHSQQFIPGSFSEITEKAVFGDEASLAFKLRLVNSKQAWIIYMLFISVTVSVEIRMLCGKNQMLWSSSRSLVQSRSGRATQRLTIVWTARESSHGWCADTTAGQFADLYRAVQNPLWAFTQMKYFLKFIVHFSKSLIEDVWEPKRARVHKGMRHYWKCLCREHSVAITEQWSDF